MSEQASLLGLAKAPVDNDRDRAMSLDRTPLPVVRQILKALSLGWGDEAVHRDGSPDLDRRAHAGENMIVLDVGAGEGAWGVVARELWPECRLVAIEPRDDAMPDARRNYDEVFHGEFQDFTTDERFDLIVGNPPFSRKLEGGKKENLFPKLVPFGVELLHPEGSLCYYSTNQLGQRGVATVELYETYPPSKELRVTGSIGHRGPKREDVHGSGSGDSACYCAWVWHAEDLADCRTDRGWMSRNLPMLDIEDRRWKTVPGS